MLRWRPVKGEMRGRQERRKTGGRRKETDGGKDYQMRRWISWGQHLKNSNKGKKRKRDNLLYWNGHNLFAHQLLGVYF